MTTAKVGTYRCSLVREDEITYEPTSLPRDAANLIRQAIPLDDPREHVIVIALNTRNRPILISTVSIGTLNGSLVHPREVFRPAILVGAAAIILGHNHPSGEVAPSAEDRALHVRLQHAGRILGIDLMDSIVVGDKGAYYSFAENGL
jgi:DNA repair protein RadC